MNLDLRDSALKHRLAGAAHGLGNVIRSLKIESSNDNGETVAARHALRAVAIRQRIDAELKKKGNRITLALLKAEFERDLNGILGQLLAWQERLDSRTSEHYSRERHISRGR